MSPYSPYWPPGEALRSNDSALYHYQWSRLIQTDQGNFEARREGEEEGEERRHVVGIWWLQIGLEGVGLAYSRGSERWRHKGKAHGVDTGLCLVFPSRGRGRNLAIRARLLIRVPDSRRNLFKMAAIKWDRPRGYWRVGRGLFILLSHQNRALCEFKELG